MDSIAFDQPWLLLLWPILAVGVALLGLRWLVALDAVRRWTAIVLRLALLAVIVLMLAGLQAVQTRQNLTVFALLDQSESVQRFAEPPALDDSPNEAADGENQRSIQRWAQRYLRRASDGKQKDDQFGWLRYDAQPSIEKLPGSGIRLQSGTVDAAREGTDTAAAIRQALPIVPEGGRLVLISDGNETSAAGSAGSAVARSELLAAARDAKAKNIAIDVLPLRYRVKQEAIVEGVYAPTEARRGQTVQLRVVLRATQPMAGQLHLLHDRNAVDLNGDAPGKATPVTTNDWTRETESNLPNAPQPKNASNANEASAPQNNANDDASPSPSNNGKETNGNRAAPDNKRSDKTGQYVAVKPIELPLAYSGVNQFEAAFEPATDQARQADRADNNAARGFTIVHGKGRVLFVSNVPGQQGNILPSALKDRGIALDVVSPTGLPGNISQLQRYDAVVFQNVPAERVTVPQQKMLARYVNDLGGGFVMVGGPKSFGAGGWTNSPIDRILPVDCQVPSQTVLPSGGLALVIDRSGSMAGRKQRLANEAGVLALKTLYPEDRISVIAFDNSATRIVPLQPNSDPPKIASKVRSIRSGGGTNIYAGLNKAYEDLAPLETQDAAVKHIILLTDGHSQTGNPIDLARKMSKAGISLSTVGVGPRKKDAFLQQLAQMTGGKYHPINNPNNLPQVFIKEARRIRKNLIKEQTFTPKVYPAKSPIMAGLSNVPKLKGLVLTGEKDDPRVFMPILGKEGEPVFAHWQVGLGRAAAFTSDATARWASDWVQWPGYGDFWAAVMRRISRPSASQSADLMTHIEAGTLRVRLDAASVSDQARFANNLSVQGSVLKPNGQTEPVTLQQTGPGVYETTMSAPSSGNYIATLFVESPNGQRRTVFGGATKTPGNELRQFRSNPAVLKRIAQTTGGEVLDPAKPQNARLFSRERTFTARSIQPMWRPLLVIALVLLLLDVANRRIAWEPRAIAAWGRARVQALAAMMTHRRVESEQTLGALKGRREQTREQYQAQSAAAANTEGTRQQPDAAQAEAPTRTARFDVGKHATPSGDFTEAVGAASEQTDTAVAEQTQPAQGEDQQSAGESTGSRLRAAKQRTRQKLGREDNES